jgi:hypothetical protein
MTTVLPTHPSRSMVGGMTTNRWKEETVADLDQGLISRANEPVDTEDSGLDEGEGIDTHALVDKLTRRARRLGRRMRRAENVPARILKLMD